MIETKLAVFQVDVSRETGEVMLFIETGYGMRSVMGWPNVSGLQDFARSLLNIIAHIDSRINNVYHTGLPDHKIKGT